MGYDFHITRADDWAESDRRPITRDEWLAVVAEDPELRLDPKNGPCFAVWSGKKGHPEPWFDWADGQVFTKNPKRAELSKMLELAKRFGAKVQGDDGEVYSSSTEGPESESFDAIIGANHDTGGRPWWKFW